MEKEINNKIYFLSALTFFFGTITLFYYGLISGWNYRFILNQEFYLTGLQSQLGFFIDVLNCFFALLLSLLFFTYWIIFKDKRDQSLKSDLIFFLLALFVLFSDNLLFPLVGFLFIFSFFIEKKKLLLRIFFFFLI